VIADFLGPTAAYAGGNPDELDDIFGDTKGKLDKAKKDRAAAEKDRAAAEKLAQKSKNELERYKHHD
jgi:hypothetical protein